MQFVSSQNSIPILIEKIEKVQQFLHYDKKLGDCSSQSPQVYLHIEMSLYSEHELHWLTHPPNHEYGSGNLNS
jgi:hypothetical protein